MSGRLRVNLRPRPLSFGDVASQITRSFCEDPKHREGYLVRLFLKAMDNDIKIEKENESAARRHTAVYLNDLFDRIVWCFDHPESSLHITEEGPRLGDEDEVLFKIGRTAR